MAAAPPTPTATTRKTPFLLLFDLRLKISVVTIMNPTISTTSGGFEEAIRLLEERGEGALGKGEVRTWESGCRVGCWL